MDMPAVPWLVEGVGAALTGVRLTNHDVPTVAVDWAAGQAAVLSLGADAAVQLTVVTECLAVEELLSLATPCPASSALWSCPTGAFALIGRVHGVGTG